MTLLKYLRRLNCIDLLLFSYVIATMLFLLVFSQEIPFAGIHILYRFVFMGFLFALPLFDNVLTKPVFKFLRIAYPLIFISFFYSETDALNNVFFSNLDYHFARFDSMLFGFQPSLAFYNRFPGKWFSELMNFGYISYYFLIVAFSIYIFVKDRSRFTYTVFCITCSFLIYYITFIIIPVSGPQYFFDSPHNAIADSGVFRTCVKLIDMLGERPTAAFPSSHVGMILILILMAWPKHIKTWYWLVPFFILLSLSTVYIKAHYAVDVAGGLISAPIILWLSKRMYNVFNKEKSYSNIKSKYAKGIDC